MPYRPDLPPAMIPNPCRHPANHILPNTYLVYQFIYIENIKNINFTIFYVYIRLFGGNMIIMILRPGVHSFFSNNVKWLCYMLHSSVSKVHWVDKWDLSCSFSFYFISFLFELSMSFNIIWTALSAIKELIYPTLSGIHCLCNIFVKPYAS